MADFAPSATPRYVLKYVNAGVEHTIMFRAARGTSMGALQTIGEGAVDDLFDALGPFLCTDLAAVSATLYEEDSEVGIPTGVPTLPAGDQVVADYSPTDKVSFFGFAGKGTGGSKVSVKVFGILTGDAPDEPAADGVIKPGESVAVTAAVNALSAQSGLRAIDNTAIAVWYPRVTYKVHDRWLREVRKGTVT